MLEVKDYSKQELADAMYACNIKPKSRIKKLWREMRKELKARLDAGEDIERTLVETRKELRTLGLYREELEEHLKEFAAEKEMTERDMRDFVEAANMMLKERGAREIEMPEMLIRKLRLRDARRKSAGGR